MTKNYKFGIVGSGMIAKYHAKAISEIDNAELIAIYARDASKNGDLSEVYNCSIYNDLDRMLSNAEIDIVTIATPSGAHLEPSRKAAKWGKHILCEKPLEVTTQRIEEMIKFCQNQGVVLGGIFNRRFNPAVKLLKEAIDHKRFGTIAIADAQIKWYRSQEYYDSGAWRGTWLLDGGGALMNQAIHTIDLLQYLMGDIVELCGVVNTVAHQSIEVEDTAVAMLKFKNGAIGSIQASTACWSKTGHPSMINISGDTGSVFMADDRFRIWEFRDELDIDHQVRRELMTQDNAGLGANDANNIDHMGHKSNIEDFIGAIDKNEVPQINGEEAMKAVRIVRAIYESAQNSGKWIKL